MGPIVLRYLNPIFLVLLALLSLSIQTTLFSSYILRFLQPDIIVILVVWMSLRRKITEGGVLTLIFAYVAEINSGSTKGLLLISYLYVYLLIRLMNRYLLLGATHKLFSVTIFCSLAVMAAQWIVLKLLNINIFSWTNIARSFALSTLSTALFGLWVFPLLEKLDQLTYRYTPSEIDDSEENHEHYYAEEGL